MTEQFSQMTFNQKIDQKNVFRKVTNRNAVPNSIAALARFLEEAFDIFANTFYYVVLSTARKTKLLMRSSEFGGQILSSHTCVAVHRPQPSSSSSIFEAPN